MTKDIAGYEGLYTVNDKGEVFSLRSKKFLVPIAVGGRYLYVHLCNGKKTKLKRLHRLVAEAFIPNPNRLPQVNHIDDRATDGASWNFCPNCGADMREAVNW